MTTVDLKELGYQDKYIKKDKEPNWDDLPQVKPYWEEFKQYKLSEESQEKSEQAKVNAPNKKYNHHLGAAGYKKSVKKMAEDGAGPYG